MSGASIGLVILVVIVHVAALVQAWRGHKLQRVVRDEMGRARCVRIGRRMVAAGLPVDDVATAIAAAEDHAGIRTLIEAWDEQDHQAAAIWDRIQGELAALGGRAA